MKAKRLMTVFTVLALCLVACLAFVGCKDKDGDNGSGDNGGGNTDTTASCDTAGHSYGDWEIVKPTVYTEGKATKVCSRDNTHKVEHTLPVLTKKGTGYASANGDENYLYHYTYATDDGDISFDTHAVFSLDEALDAAKKTAGKVTSGVATNRMVIYGQDNSHDIAYEFGDNYLHVLDDSALTEGWYTFGEDEIFSVLKTYDRLGREIYQPDRALSSDTDTAKVSPEGYPFGFVYFGDGYRDNGVANYLYYMYLRGANNANKDYESGIKNVDGKQVFWFSYGNYYASEKGMNVAYAEFTLNDDLVVDSAVFSVKTYTSKYCTQDDDGICTVNPGAEENYAAFESFSVTQTDTRTGDVPTNPFSLDDMLLGSYDLEFVTLNSSGDIVSGAPVEGNAFTVNPDTGIRMRLINIQPSEANFYFDNVGVYLRTDDGDVSIVHDASHSLKDGELIASFDPVENVIAFKSLLAGEHKVVIKTAATERVLTVTVPVMNPASFNSDVYMYDELTDRGYWDNGQTTKFEIYKGQSLNIACAVSHPAYEETGYDIVATLGSVTVPLVFTKGMKDGKEVQIFNATDVGTYTVTLTSHGSAHKTHTITIDVVEPPAIADLLKGGYENTKEEIDVMFVPASDGAVAGEVTVVFGTGDNTENSVYDYSYSDGTVTLTYKSGVEKTIAIEISEQYNLFINYNNAMDEPKHTLLNKSGALVSAINGDYVFEAAYPTPLTADIEGLYEIKSNCGYNDSRLYDKKSNPDSLCVFYRINDEKSPFITEDTIVYLKAGDTLEVCKMMEYSGTYTITYKGMPEVASSITLDKNTASVVVGGETVTITATVGPENTFDKSVAWTSSDDGIATVSESGVITGVSEGTVTITATTSNDLTATCTVTVTFIHATAITVDGHENSYDVSVELGKTVTLEVVVSPADASDKSIQWINDGNGNSVVAFEVNNHTLTGMGEGTVNITGTCKSDPSVTFVLHVTVWKTPVTEVILDKGEANLVINETLTLAATVSPDNASKKNITWSSSNTDVATVNSNGVVTAKGVGTAIITVTSVDDPTKTATCTVTVTKIPVESITLSATEVTIKYGTTTGLPTVTVTPDNATFKTYTWTSSDESILKNNNGKVLAVGIGEVTVTFVCDDNPEVKATCKVTVTADELQNGTAVSLSGLSNYKYYVLRGEANTQYTVTDGGSNKVQFYTCENGVRNYDTIGTGMATYTTNAQGYVIVCMRCKSFSGTMTVEKTTATA